MMLVKAVLCLSSLHFFSVAAQEQCTDLRGRLISHGLHYVPGPDTCTLCVCDNGLPKVCKAVLCSPPQDCRSFRVGNTCCEFICLDDVVKPAEGAEANVRMAAGGAAAVVLLTVALVVYRVRKQKRRRPPHADDQRSLTSIGYISGSMGYMGGTCETALAAWKPSSNYLPRGEAPPPYDEAIAQCRPENMRVSNEPSYHRTYPATVETMSRPDDVPCAGHGYVNVPRPVTQIANTQNCYNAPLLQPVHQPDSREPASMTHHPLAPNMVGFPSAIRLTGSLGAISNRGLLSVLARESDRGADRGPDRDHERPHNVPGFYTNAPNVHTSLHRTIPRISTAVDATLLDTPISGFNRADRSLHNEIRRSFHKPSDNNRHNADTGRSMPRNLNLASANDITRNIEPVDVDTSQARLSGSTGWRGRTHSEEHNVGAERAADTATPAPHAQHTQHTQHNQHTQHTQHNQHTQHTQHTQHPQHTQHTRGPHAPPTPAPAPPAPQPTLPLTVDKPSCVCSYSGSAPGAEDADDYRSECENCKSASSSRWVLEEGWEGGGLEGGGTQTLQRRAPPAPAPPPATATLPQPVTKQPRTVMGPPSNWENWFNTIPDSDSESEEE
ncbi:uncharacterized protein LOC111355013 isoform X2 [Spodoptera litura]|uniref:Uncharacterized protein LOC111355013 isoform X2 n=1 Tax=Spodoptera litura TaxID=69820 RepID=A0A9J7IV79_SPOLT|nr:uncharacterized protein LOC111355013 isoform X2 [Spodoptera litura]